MESNNSSKKQPVLPILHELATKIRHKHEKLEKNPQDAQMMLSLRKDIGVYIDVCLAAIKEGAIGQDPFKIVEGRGFKDDSIGNKMVDLHMQDLMSKDSTGWVASVYVNGRAGRGWDVIGWAKDGWMFCYRHAKKAIIVVKNGVVRAWDWVAGKLSQFWNWLKAKWNEFFPGEGKKKVKTAKVETPQTAGEFDLGGEAETGAAAPAAA